MSGTTYKYAPDWAKYDPRFYGAFATGSSGTVNAAAIQAAIDAASAAGGGIVPLPEGTYTIRQLVMKGHVWLRGSGHLATRLVLEASQNKHAIINKVSTNGTTDPNALYYHISDLCIDGNKANNTTGNGIFLSRYPAYTPATQDEGGDSDLQWENLATVERVLVLRAKSNGFASENIGTVRFLNCWAEHCDGNGFAPGFDSQTIGCVASNSGLAGFAVAAPSIRLEACKSYYSGAVTAGSGHGFNITSHHCLIGNCEAQDNKAAGFLLDGAHGNILQGCNADSNSTSSTGTYPGFDLWDCDYNVISGSCSERRADGTNSRQRSAVQIRQGAVGNQIQLTHWAETWNSAVIDAAVHSGSNAVSGNTVVINNQLGSQAIAYSATITPDPYLGGKVVVGTLTGNITVNAPSNAHAGCRLSFKFTQDTTAGRTVTWNSVYKRNWTPTTTNGKINTIEFEYDGTNWIQVGGTVGI